MSGVNLWAQLVCACVQLVSGVALLWAVVHQARANERARRADNELRASWGKVLDFEPMKCPRCKRDSVWFEGGELVCNSCDWPTKNPEHSSTGQPLKPQ